MQLTPQYGPDPIIVLLGDPSAIAEPVIRQRRRLATLLGELTEEQWAHPSRCAGWSTRDVIVHLDSTNAFWSFSVAQGLKGTPTEFLATFDPVASPAQLVEAAGDLRGPEVAEKFQASTDALVGLFESLDETGWTTTAEAPPGHLSVAALAHHALWDSWIHERDVLLPLGRDQVIEADEVVRALAYAAALGPAFAVSRGESTPATLAVAVTDPEASVAVRITDHVEVEPDADHPDDGADLVLEGDAVTLAEELSIRLPLSHSIPTEVAWMVDGLYTTFDTVRT